jgi:hypothetical protein
VTSTLAFVQTAGVVEVRTTGRPELASAATGNGEIPKIWLGIESNLMVCGVCAESWPDPAQTPNTKVAAVLVNLFIGKSRQPVERGPATRREEKDPQQRIASLSQI